MKITVTDEMRKAARNVLRAFVSGPHQGMIGSSELARSAAVELILAAALNTSVKDEFLPLPATLTDEYLREVRNLAAPMTGEEEPHVFAKDAPAVLRARAEKAEQERDEVRKSLHEAVETVESLRTMTARDHLNAACQAGHPLPKGATIPEGAAFWVRSPGEPWEFVSPGPDEDFDTSRFPNSQYVLLDPPRPKGAEEWDEELGEMPAASDLTAEQRARLADALAERDHALGVRVVSEDGAS